MKADHYDSFAESYSTENESSLFNAYYERPAVIDLAGDVDGHRVLDAGSRVTDPAMCRRLNDWLSAGAGPYLACAGSNSRNNVER